MCFSSSWFSRKVCTFAKSYTSSMKWCLVTCCSVCCRYYGRLAEGYLHAQSKVYPFLMVSLQWFNSATGFLSRKFVTRFRKTTDIFSCTDKLPDKLRDVASTFDQQWDESVSYNALANCDANTFINVNNVTRHKYDSMFIMIIIVTFAKN